MEATFCVLEASSWGSRGRQNSTGGGEDGGGRYWIHRVTQGWMDRNGVQHPHPDLVLDLQAGC